jgi:hypothetical protein
MKLKRLIKRMGEDGLARLSVETGVSISTLQKMICGGYTSSVRKLTRSRLSEFFNVAERELFDLVSEDERDSA